MVFDFGLIKNSIFKIIDAFDHAITLWDKDDIEYIEFAKKFSKRWVVLPVSPSAEQFSRVFFVVIDNLLKDIIFKNGEQGVKLYSIIVHETDTGYAQSFVDDAYSEAMGCIDISKIEFSDELIKELDR